MGEPSVFLTYRAILEKWQRAVNLVATSTLPDAETRHFADSFQLSDFIPANGTLYDLGSGGGFPGLVLALARPDLRVFLIESDGKKCEFLRTVSRETGCTNVSIWQERLEVSVQTRPPPDIITARAFASLTNILDWTKEWRDRKLDLAYLLLKGKQWEKEVDEARATHLFHVEHFPSKTEAEAVILKITNPC